MLLNLTLWLPAAGFAALLFLPRGKDSAVRWTGLIVALATLALSLGLVGGIPSGEAGDRFVTDLPWIPSPAIRYHIGLDGISLWLVLLSTLLTPLSILISWKYI